MNPKKIILVCFSHCRVNTFPIIYDPESHKHFKKLERPIPEDAVTDLASDNGMLLNPYAYIILYGDFFYGTTLL